ncbi:MAG: hypothetical protein IV085_10455 [Thiobacillus sp.]|nr:hypothetical protein [Thiobacillus sp.]
MARLAGLPPAADNTLIFFSAFGEALSTPPNKVGASHTSARRGFVFFRFNPSSNDISIYLSSLYRLYGTALKNAATSNRAHVHFKKAEVS